MSEPSLKVVVFVGVGDAELRAEIEKYPSRARASRMRTLANLGLQTIQTGAPSLRAGRDSNGIEETPTPTDKPAEAVNSSVVAPALQEDAARRLRNKMRRCLS
jgi:hypothetical protein